MGASCEAVSTGLLVHAICLTNAQAHVLGKCRCRFFPALRGGARTPCAWEKPAFEQTGAVAQALKRARWAWPQLHDFQARKGVQLDLIWTRHGRSVAPAREPLEAATADGADHILHSPEGEHDGQGHGAGSINQGIASTVGGGRAREVGRSWKGLQGTRTTPSQVWWRWAAPCRATAAKEERRAAAQCVCEGRLHINVAVREVVDGAACAGEHLAMRVRGAFSRRLVIWTHK